MIGTIHFRGAKYNTKLSIKIMFLFTDDGKIIIKIKKKEEKFSNKNEIQHEGRIISNHEKFENCVRSSQCVWLCTVHPHLYKLNNWLAPMNFVYK